MSVIKTPAWQVKTTSARGDVQKDLDWLLTLCQGVVTPSMFGIFPESRVGGSTLTDVTDKFRSMVQYCVDNNLYLDTCIPGDTTSVDSSVGFYVTKPVDLTGLAGLRGVLPIFVDGNTFTDDKGFGFAVLVANAKFNGTTIEGNTTRGNLNYDWIEVRNLNRRSGTVRGIQWTASRSTIGKLRANGFNGRGIWLAHAYDSTFGRCEVEWSGTKDEWAFDAAYYSPSSGFSDETNGLHIDSLLVHNCTDRAWRGFGSKMHIGTVHEEATYSMSPPTNPSTQDVRTSLGYMNSYFSSTGGSLGPVSIQPSSSSTQNHVFACGFVGTSVSTIYTTGTTVIMPGDPAQRGGSVSTIYTRDLYIIEQARTTISRVEVVGSLYGRGIRNDSPILGGYITSVAENTGDIHNVVFRTPVVISPLASHSYVRCTFLEGLLSTSSARVTVDTCIFSKLVRLGDNSKMDFLNCLFSAGLSIGGSTLDVIFKGGQVSGDLTFDGVISGSWLFPDPPRITGKIVNWQWPLATAVTGSRTRHPAPANVDGASVERVYNGTQWITTIKISVPTTPPPAP